MHIGLFITGIGLLFFYRKFIKPITSSQKYIDAKLPRLLLKELEKMLDL